MATHTCTLLLVTLTTLVPLCTAYSPYPDPGPDLPPSQHFCRARPVQQCCPGRDDYCTMPILDTVCYCDMFCNRTVSDCCPDFWGHCMGIEPPPGALTPPPVTDFVNNCVHYGITYDLGAMITSNCNNCTCVEVPGLKKEWNWKCTQHLCLIRPEIIDHVNALQDVGWRAGNHSNLYGLTLDEGVIYRLGTFEPGDLVRQMTSLKVHIDEVLPERFDAREEWPQLIHKVQDQGNCGSSWAFSTIGVASDRLSIHSNGYFKDLLSPQHLISCNYDPNQKGCEGGHLDRAWWYMRNRGVVSDACYPYTSGATNSPGSCLIPNQYISASAQPQCPGSSQQSSSRVYQAAPPYRIAPNEREIMKEILENGPVQATLEVKEDFYMYKSGVYRYSRPADYLFPNHRRTGFHSVRIIGWGTEVINNREYKYWLCVNSWGEEWGENGLFKIAKGEDMCKIESFVLGTWGKVNGRQIVSRRNNRRNNRRRNDIQGDEPLEAESISMHLDDDTPLADVQDNVQRQTNKDNGKKKKADREARKQRRKEEKERRRQEKKEQKRKLREQRRKERKNNKRKNKKKNKDNLLIDTES